MRVEETIAELERVAAREVGRGSGRLAAPVVGAAITAAAPDVPLDVAPLRGYDHWADAARTRYAGLTHLIACERVGPGVDGRPRNMRGEDIGAHTAALDRLYAAGSGFRIGIGDGGNELGMGRLPADLVGRVVDRGERIRCVVDCDALLVGGTSNWAAAALVGALALLRPEVTALRDLLRPDWSYDVLTAIVLHAGAVDGVRRQAQLSVDGLDWPAYAQPLARIAELVGEAAR